MLLRMNVAASLSGGRVALLRRSLGAAVAGTAAAAAASATAPEGLAGFDLEAHVGEVYANGFYLGQQVAVDAEREVAFVEHLVVIVRLIQSQCQPGAASATGGEIDADGVFLLVRKVGFKLLAGVFSKLEHAILHGWYTESQS